MRANKLRFNPDKRETLFICGVSSDGRSWVVMGEVYIHLKGAGLWILNNECDITSCHNKLKYIKIENEFSSVRELRTHPKF